MSNLSKQASKLLLTALCGLLSNTVSFKYAGATEDTYRFTGPYTHENLSLYLIHGENKFDASEILTLDEALERKQVVVHETGQVDELSIENISTYAMVFVQAGDIVKGGKQDRVITNDLLLKTKSGKIPLASFCVEQGRWQKRGSETLERFSSSKKRINSKELKLAAQSEKAQGQVWQKVEAMQAKLSRNVGAGVRSEDSASSLQLSLESDTVVESTENYRNKLLPIIDGKSDALGYVFAINGKLNSAEVYGANSLFVKLWPKLLDATASEAISERDAPKTESNITTAQLQEFLESAEAATEKERKRIAASESIRKEDSKAAYFETRVSEFSDAVIHKQYLKK